MLVKVSKTEYENVYLFAFNTDVNTGKKRKNLNKYTHLHSNSIELEMIFSVNSLLFPQ